MSVNDVPLLLAALLPDLGAGIMTLLAYLVIGLAPAVGIAYAIYVLLTLPLRRNERARMFLNLLELGIKEGQAPEAVIASASASRDRSLGVRFHWLAAHIEQGLRLSEALERVPRLLPPQVCAMLRIGERIDEVQKVFPACRWLLRDSVSQVRGALNYLLLAVFAITPGLFIILFWLKKALLPQFMAIYASLEEGMSLPAFTRLIFNDSPALLAIQLGVLAILWGVTLAYLGGPRLHGWIHRLAPGLQDGFLARLPWRNHRLRRDFSAMLALLLDAGAPEAEAVRLAAESTANQTFIRRGQRVCARLQQGVSLPEALRAMDNTPELHWRLAHALRRGAGFVRALGGWHEALDARAFQWEQAAAQVLTTGLVLVSGLVVGGFAIGIFLVIVQIINTGCLW